MLRGLMMILQNLSHSLMWMERLGTADEPKPEVLDVRNQVLYPPPFPRPRLNGTFKSGIPPLIAREAVIIEYPLVVLRGNRIHAVLHFHLERAPPYPRITLRTPVIRLSLTSARAPTLKMCSSPPVAAIVHPVSNQQRGGLCRLSH